MKGHMKSFPGAELHPTLEILLELDSFTGFLTAEGLGKLSVPALRECVRITGAVFVLTSLRIRVEICVSYDGEACLPHGGD